jgi:urease accessory protein
VLNLLPALQQADAAFPSGGFAFSNGVEGLDAMGVRLDGPALAGVMEAVLRHRWTPCDRIALAQAWRAGPDVPRMAEIGRALEAATLPESLRLGSRRNGAALLAAHVRLGTPGASALQAALEADALLGHLPLLQGALWRAVGLDEAAAIQVSGYTAASGVASAAVRLGCLGALPAQAALRDVLPLIAELSRGPVPDINRLGGFLPWLDIACARQQGASLRLFAS